MVKIRETKDDAQAANQFGQKAKDFDFAEDSLNQIGTEELRKYKTGECKPWHLHNRSDLWFGTPQAETLKQSILDFGQQQPGLVRESTMVDSEHEIIFGVRRWHACRELNVPFEARVIPSDTTDSMCARLMEVENEESENITEFEKARAYRAQLQSKVFSNQNELAEAHHLSKQYVSKLLVAAKLMDIDWLSEFINPLLLQISVKKASTLYAATTQRGARSKMEKVIQAMNEDQRKNFDAMYSLLLNAMNPPIKPVEKIFTKSGNKITAASKIDSKGAIAIKIDAANIKAEQVEKMLAELQLYLSQEIAKHK